MKISRIALLATALVAWSAAACAAENRIVPCKNHYILDPCPPESTVQTVRISKVFTTLDATVQLVELQFAGDLPPRLAGRTIAVRDTRGRVRSFTAGNEPYMPPDRTSTILLMSSAWLEGVSDYWGSYADVDMPDYFLPIDGGVLSIEGLDEFAFGPLPVDGWHALARDGSEVPADFARRPGLTEPWMTLVREFHHPALDHYFMTDRADEVALLVSGDIPGWQATGRALMFFAEDFGEAFDPVCRYLLLRDGGHSHFFSGRRDECARLADDPRNVLESSVAYYSGMPTDGECITTATVNFFNGSSASFVVGGPIYRLWNGSTSLPNHRFVADAAERDAMVARGWIPEGAGGSGVALCAYSADPPPLPAP